MLYVSPDSINVDMLEGDTSFFCREATHLYVSPYDYEGERKMSYSDIYV